MMSIPEWIIWAGLCVIALVGLWFLLSLRGTLRGRTNHARYLAWQALAGVVIAVTAFAVGAAIVISVDEPQRHLGMAVIMIGTGITFAVVAVMSGISVLRYAESGEVPPIVTRGRIP